MELSRQCMDIEEARLSQYHSYNDETLDRPFLTPESILLEDEQVENTRLDKEQKDDD